MEVEMIVVVVQIPEYKTILSRTCNNGYVRRYGISQNSNCSGKACPHGIVIQSVRQLNDSCGS